MSRIVNGKTRLLAIRRATWWRRAWDRLDVSPWEVSIWVAFVVYLLAHIIAAKAAGRI